MQVSSLASLPSGQSWNLVFNDDFNTLNLNVWGNNGTPWGTESHDGNCDLQTSANTLTGSKLLAVRANKGPNIGPNGKCYPYLGAYVWTKTRRTYGYLEIRAQFPRVKGGWPAFWMLGDGWPPEIDIDEFRGDPINEMRHGFYDETWTTPVSTGDFTAWHTYGLLLEPGRLKFYIDNLLVATTTKGIVPAIPMYIILSNGADCSSANSTGWPNDFKIDYFKWYQVAPISPIVSGATYHIVSATNNASVLDVVGNGTDDGTKVDIWKNNAGNNQKWKVSSVESGYYKIQPLNALTKALDLTNASNANGTQIEIWADNASSAQKWKITDVGGGYFMLTPACATSSRLYITGGSSTDGTKVEIWGSNHSVGQTFKFVPE